VGERPSRAPSRRYVALPTVGLVGLLALASGLDLAIDVEQGSLAQWDVAVRRLDCPSDVEAINRDEQQSEPGDPSDP
jgi:hypothetical protein